MAALLLVVGLETQSELGAVLDGEARFLGLFRWHATVALGVGEAQVVDLDEVRRQETATVVTLTPLVIYDEADGFSGHVLSHCPALGRTVAASAGLVIGLVRVTSSRSAPFSGGSFLSPDDSGVGQGEASPPRMRRRKDGAMQRKAEPGLYDHLPYFDRPAISDLTLQLYSGLAHSKSR